MSRTTDTAAESDASSGMTRPVRRAPFRQPDTRRIPRLGMLAWSFVGCVVAAAIVVLTLAAVSEIVVPLVFAAVLAVIFKPVVRFLRNKRLNAGLAAGLVVLCLLLLMVAVCVATLRGVTEQADEIGSVTDKAIGNAANQVDALGISRAALDDARTATEQATPMISTGLVTHLVSGIGTLIGLASAVVLGLLIMYYLLKDGSRFRRNVVRQFRDASVRDEIDDFIGHTCEVLRDYGRGRTVMSASVAIVIGLVSLALGLPLVFTIMVVNFIGGYIPYIGAFLGGGLAVIVALGDGGLPEAAAMLLVVLAANLLLENIVEPKVMGRTLDLHPLVVVIATAFGGMVGGILGLILAVPIYVIARDAISRWRSGAFSPAAADGAPSTGQQEREPHT